ncbi:dihydroxyacetone kinase phosphoryl donor subunit DhaM [Mycoplasma corogypsi]|uniref:dihydroxyacetone kinase phosphoryl donor subunit DhaM n=1 Tax=Mycoplasma corogypsi TaxID=2106 RepID=UPI0038736050
MINFVVVSHSKKLVDEAIKLANIMKCDEFITLNAGGMPFSDELGTDVSYIIEQINSLMDSEYIFVFCEMGSSLLSTQMALEMLANEKVILADAPLIEGLMVATAANYKGATKDTILHELQQLKNFTKTI